MQNETVTYALTLFTNGQPPSKAKLTLEPAGAGGSIRDLMKPGSAGSIGDGQITTTVVPLKGTFTMLAPSVSDDHTVAVDGYPLPMAGAAFVTALGPVLCIKLHNAEQGPTWRIDFSLIDPSGGSIGGYASTSSPALGTNWSFLGYIPS